jgi:hypothetical protein
MVNQHKIKSLSPRSTAEQYARRIIFTRLGPPTPPSTLLMERMAQRILPILHFGQTAPAYFQSGIRSVPDC